MKAIIYAQRKSDLNILELVIYDNGVGISGSLSKAKKTHLSPKESLLLVLEHGESAKKQYDKERGEGIATVRRLVTKIPTLEGELIIMSGNVAAYLTYDKREVLYFPLRCFVGTLIIIRINNENELYQLDMDLIMNLIADYE